MAKLGRVLGRKRKRNWKKILKNKREKNGMDGKGRKEFLERKDHIDNKEKG